jgi:hypothetical protein
MTVWIHAMPLGHAVFIPVSHYNAAQQWHYVMAWPGYRNWRWSMVRATTAKVFLANNRAITMGWLGLFGVLKMLVAATMGCCFASLKFSIPFWLVSF